MAALRAFFISVALAAFFLIGTPLQWLVARYAPKAAHPIPMFFCRSLLWLFRIRLRVEGTRIADRPVLMVANHVSWIDILALGGIMPFCFLAKTEVAGWPILSAFAEVQGTVFVDRRRRRSIPLANRQMAARMRAGRSVLIFPEGTTIGTAEPAPFRTSHFAVARDFLRLSARDVAEDASLDPVWTEVMVQPVAIAYSSPDAAWIGDDALLPHVWRTLRAPPLTCLVAFASPIAYGATSDRKLVAREAREAIVTLIGKRHPAPSAPYEPIDLVAARPC